MSLHSDDPTIDAGGPFEPRRRPEPPKAKDSASPSKARFPPGTILAGRYRLVALLGRGGMGEVYRADDLKLGQTVALKFLPEELTFDGTALARFHNEVRVARRIAHRNVCRVHDIGEAEGYHFLTMEYIDGENLSTLLRRIGRLPQNKATELALQICSGLTAAHAANVLHRDLKPANVMIDGKGKAKITDFGLSYLQDELRQSGLDVLAGTPAYMAPEQLRGDAFTKRTDLFALGLVLYEMFTGEPAFADEDWIQLVTRGGRRPPPNDPSHYVESLDLDVGRVLMHCLEQEPANRPGSALEVAMALPGGDLLRASLEAGELPSPEMVAGICERRALSSARSAVALTIFAFALVVFHATAKDTTLLGMVAPKLPPEVLADRAQSLLLELGWTETQGPAADAFGAFRYDDEVIERFRGTRDEWRRRATERPAMIQYFRRTSDSSLFDPRVHQPTPSIPEPRPGDAFVRLDPQGRLEQFRLDARGTAPAGGPPDWQRIFAQAGLEPADFAELPVPPLNGGDRELPIHELRRSWFGRLDGRDVRVDTASFGSLPVFFRLLQNNDLPSRRHFGVSNWLFRAFYAVLGLAAVATVQNLRRRRGDVRGAVVTAGLVASTSFVAELVSRHRGTSAVEIGFLTDFVSTVTYRAFVVLIFYLAMEPAVRAWAPEFIVSWTRLARGRWRDSRVGRDVLTGLAIGMVAMVVFAHVRWLSTSSPLTIYDLDAKLSGVGPELGLLGRLIFLATTGTLAAAFCFAFAHRWLKRRWLTGTVLTLAVALLAQDPLSTALVVALATSGVLTVIFAWAAIALVGYTPSTADPSLWWAWPEAWLMSALLLAVALVAFRNVTVRGALPLAASSS